MENYIREPINSLTHLFGAVLSVFGLVALIMKAWTTTESGLAITAVTIFGISMILLYSASTTYHWVKAKDTIIRFFRKLDHSMIFVLIAGTYAPFCLIALKGPIGWTMFSIIGGMAVAGVLFKMVWFKCPRWLSTALYIGMGWMAILVISPLSKSMETGGIVLLVLGGVFYTIGGIIYGTEPKFLKLKNWGFHEIFHIFILLGSLAHFLSIYFYVL